MNLKNKPFWKEHWDKNLLPWRFDGADDMLKKSAPIIAKMVPKGSRVLVPLCGDSPAVQKLHEMKYSVTGVDFVPEALDKLRTHYFSSVPESEAPRLVCDDFFHFADMTNEQFQLVYDRAAFVALSPTERDRYSEALESVIVDDGLLLLEFFSAGSFVGEDPPYAASLSSVLRLFPAFSITRYSVVGLPVGDGHFAPSNYSLFERNWLLLKKRI